MASRNSIQDVWGERTPYDGPGQWPQRIDEHLTEVPDRWVQSACVLCTNGCGVEIGVKDNRLVGVRGRADDPINRGRLGPKGLHGWIANGSGDRLTQPMIRTGRKGVGAFRAATWDEAMNLLVSHCQEVRKQFTSGATGFYTSGQLFLEDYYTISTVAMAGLGTMHLDGNTRLCTATASAALRETFGNDGQPSTAIDYDSADCIVHVGHNLASTQTVSWMRVLDRRRGRNPPKLIVIDPRSTPTAQEADIHLAPRVGTNVALLNGLLYLVIDHGDIEPDFIRRYTVGFEKLQVKVSKYTPPYVAQITGIAEEQLIAAAREIGKAKRLLCTVLQGVYQSNQATAAACQVNNLVLVRGMIGRPGCGVIQSNGQPTAQNTRETGCNGEFPGFRNWQNPLHMQQLADIWNVDVRTIPHWSPKTHAMKIFHLAETGSLKFLWIVGTNPAVSLPELHKIRSTLAQERLFVVVQDAFLTETARLADVVLPAAMWGEKTGTFTNFDRTVHISHKAADPPGEARSDMQIFLDFARRMDFRDRDEQPLLKWSTEEECFEAWKACSRGTPCDYSGMSYALLSSRSGIRWPCNKQFPKGKEELYAELHFPTSAEECGDFGHDLETGGHVPKESYQAHDPQGKAQLKGADYRPPHEQPSEEYPFWLMTGRTTYHFHTRTKTGRSPELNEAAPGAYIEIHQDDAGRLGISEGEQIRVTGPRGYADAPARFGGMPRGHLFMPFHYGYWDKLKTAGPDDHPSAANELTATSWDPISKQPQFKFSAVRIDKVTAKPLTNRIVDLASETLDRAMELTSNVLAGAHIVKSRFPIYLSLLWEAHEQFRLACQQLAKDHPENSEIVHGAQFIATFSWDIMDRLQPVLNRYGKHQDGSAERLRKSLFPAPRHGDFGLLRDLHSLYVLAAELIITSEIAIHAAQEIRDEALVSLCNFAREQSRRQEIWCLTQSQDNAAQALVVPH
jgi:ferredoxin-nitrate reductase